MEFESPVTTADNVTLTKDSATNPTVSNGSRTASEAYTASYVDPGVGNTTTLIINNAAGDDMTAAQLGVSYVLAPVASTCDTTELQTTPPNTQRAAQGSPTGDSLGGMTHTLDYRCNWTVTFTHSGGCAVTLKAERGGTERTPAPTSPVTLLKGRG